MRAGIRVRKGWQNVAVCVRAAGAEGVALRRIDIGLTPEMTRHLADISNRKNRLRGNLALDVQIVLELVGRATRLIRRAGKKVRRRNARGATITGADGEWIGKAGCRSDRRD